MLHEQAGFAGSGSFAGPQMSGPTVPGVEHPPVPAQYVEESGRGREFPVRPARLSWASELPFVAAEERSSPSKSTRRWTTRYRAGLVAMDALSATIVLGTTALTLPWAPGVSVLVVSAGLAAWIGTVCALRGYDRRRVGAGPEELQALARAGVLIGVVLSIVSYTSRTGIPRRIVLVALPSVVLLSMVGHYVGRRRLHHARRSGRAMFRTVLVGGDASVQQVAGILQRSPSDGYLVVGTCGATPPERAEAQRSVNDEMPPVLGPVWQIPQIVVDQEIDVVIVAGSHLSGDGLRRLSWALEHTGAQLIVEPGLVEVVSPRLSMRPTAGLSLLHVDNVATRRGQALGKRSLDLVLGTVLLVLAAPVIAASALLVKANDRGPAFFKQQRVGQGGRCFTMYKLRTMVVDAETRRAELQDLSDRDGLMFKMRHDPRMIRGGRVLRRFSLDELPQLVNVVKGDMSLVGPRPPLLEEHDRYRDRVFRRMRVRPGLTGLWQVSGRADLTWDEAIRLDLRYVDNWSVTMDVFILWKTARAIVRASGAY